MDNNISVIIPFYNSMKTLSQMLESIISGSLVPSEIILIDDGSTDSSGDIAMEYSKSHSNIKVIHQQHSGVSAARNLGLSSAKGKWISFLDADDYIEPDMFSLMVQAVTALPHKVDGCICGYFTHKEGLVTPYVPARESVITSKELLKYMFTDDSVRGFLFNRLFSADMLKELSFSQDIPYCEDLLFQSQLFSSKELDFVVVSKPLYHYVQNSESATSSKRFFKDGTFIYKPAFDRIFALVKEDYVWNSYNSILDYSMYSLLLSYKENKSNETLRQIKLLQKEMRLPQHSYYKKSKRRIAFERAPVLYSLFMK